MKCTLNFIILVREIFRGFYPYLRFIGIIHRQGTDRHINKHEWLAMIDDLFLE